MKKRVLFLSLALILVVILIPTTALAVSSSWFARSFNITIRPDAIDDTVIGTAWPVRDSKETNVWPIIDLVDVDGVPTYTITGWIVDGRSIHGSASGSISGDFFFTYGGVLDILQSGSIDGIVTLRAGGLDVMYLSADGDLDAEVKDYYAFDEIRDWWTGIVGPDVGVGVFFAQLYPGGEGLADVPDELLALAYGASAPLPPPYPPLPPLPPLPKTLSAVFSGKVTIGSGTGAYTGVRGTGQFGPLNKKALILSVTPDQHVTEIQGALKLTGAYTKQKPREIGKIDTKKLNEAIQKLKDRFGR